MPAQIPPRVCPRGPALTPKLCTDGHGDVTGAALVGLNDVILPLGLDQLGHDGLTRLPLDTHSDAR